MLRGINQSRDSRQNQVCSHVPPEMKTSGLLSPAGSGTSGFSYDNTPSACVRNGEERAWPFGRDACCRRTSVSDYILSLSLLLVRLPHKLPPQMSHQMGGVPMMPPQPVMYNQPVLRPTNPFGPIPGTQVEAGKDLTSVGRLGSSV